MCTANSFSRMLGTLPPSRFCKEHCTFFSCFDFNPHARDKAVFATIDIASTSSLVCCYLGCHLGIHLVVDVCLHCCSSLVSILQYASCTTWTCQQEIRFWSLIGETINNIETQYWGVTNISGCSCVTWSAQLQWYIHLCSHRPIALGYDSSWNGFRCCVWTVTLFSKSSNLIVPQTGKTPILVAMIGIRMCLGCFCLWLSSRRWCAHSSARPAGHCLAVNVANIFSACLFDLFV